MTLPLRVKVERIQSAHRIRSPGHLKFVREHSCVVKNCNGRPIEAMHVRLGSHAGMGQKPSDDATVSGCSAHHLELHRTGEATFQAKYELDLLALAAEFASKSPHRSKFRRAPNGR